MVSLPWNLAMAANASSNLLRLLLLHRIFSHKSCWVTLPGAESCHRSGGGGRSTLGQTSASKQRAIFKRTDLGNVALGLKGPKRLESLVIKHFFPFITPSNFLGPTWPKCHSSFVCPFKKTGLRFLLLFCWPKFVTVGDIFSLLCVVPRPKSCCCCFLSVQRSRYSNACTTCCAVFCSLPRGAALGGDFFVSCRYNGETSSSISSHSRSRHYFFLSLSCVHTRNFSLCAYTHRQFFLLCLHKHPILHHVLPHTHTHKIKFLLRVKSVQGQKTTPRKINVWINFSTKSQFVYRW